MPPGARAAPLDHDGLGTRVRGGESLGNRWRKSRLPSPIRQVTQDSGSGFLQARPFSAACHEAGVPLSERPPGPTVRAVWAWSAVPENSRSRVAAVTLSP